MIIGKMIANSIMLPNRRVFGDSVDDETKEGFSEAISDYFKIWDKKRFCVKSDDVNIVGEYVINPAAKESNRVMIICHGQTVNRAPDIKYGKIFYDLGFHLVLFDHRYFGESGGKYCTLGWKENKDIKRVIRFTKEVFGDNAVIGLHGESMGAASELLLLDTEKPAFVIADCPFSDLGLLIHENAKKIVGILAPLGEASAKRIGLKRCGFNYREVKPIESVKVSDVPICFIHGRTDSLIKYSHSERMYKLCKNPQCELHIVENAEHARSIYVDPEGYRKICTEFVAKILGN